VSPAPAHLCPECSSLYGSNSWDNIGVLLNRATSGSYGWFGIYVNEPFDFYTLVASPPEGHIPAGADSGSGEPDGLSHIRFVYPTPNFYVDNSFWAIVPGEAPTPTPAPTPHPPGGFGVLISEVYYDPPAGLSPEGRYEWVELFNSNPYTVTLHYWRLQDNRDSDVLPDFELSPRSFAVIVSNRDYFLKEYPGFNGQIVQIYDYGIGNGLGNSGDRLRLLNSRYELVDAVSWGKDRMYLDPSAPKVKSGHSLCRFPTDADTDTADDWTDCSVPSPGTENIQVNVTANVKIQP
jgi:hypothetical protein